MKTTILSVILGLIFISCSRDNDEVINNGSKMLEKQGKKEEKVLVTKVVHNNRGGQKTFTYSYEGDKLKEIVENYSKDYFYKTTYQYDGDLIASSLSVRENPYNETRSVVYSYDEKKYLKKSISTEKVIFNGGGIQTVTITKNYTYQANGVIIVKSDIVTETDPNSGKGSIKTKKERSEIDTYTYTNGVVTKLTSNDFYSQEIKLFEYDTKNSPLMNIRGISALAIEFFGRGEVIGGLKNNIKTITVTGKRINGKLEIGGDKVDVEYVYTSHNYPAKITLKGKNNDMETFELTYDK